MKNTPSLPQAVLTDAESMIATLKSQVRIGRARWHANKQQSNVIEVTFADADAIIAALSRMGGESVPAGLAAAQEPKYTVDGSSIVNRASGEAIPSDEPVFIFRARDKHAVEALHHYLMQVGRTDHSIAVEARIKDFTAFATAHPERMKEPDTAAPTAPAHQAADVQGERTPLQQYDREHQPGYRDGWNDGRLYGYEVGKRHATEHAAAQIVPKGGADDLPQRLIAAARREFLTWEDRIAIGNAIARIQAASAPTVGGRTLAKSDELLSTTVGLLMRYSKPSQGYKPGSVIDKIVGEVAEYLKDWPQANPAAPSSPAVEEASSAAEPVAGDVADLVKRLRDTPNWMRESFGHWKSCTMHYDRAPFEAADMLERMSRAALVVLPEALPEPALTLSTSGNYYSEEQVRAMFTFPPTPPSAPADPLQALSDFGNQLQGLNDVAAPAGAGEGEQQ